ncbi:MAG: hypothetical protein C5S38_09065 [Candidatus Methanophagaceae archaeon]|jgi:hypothetical protein|nr:MAG: hypothetical protein C5S38_09065 [Methanophagales archaeon]KAF5432986.1 hypothetical protein C5S36_07435 [Methanophagales archaeon]
MMNKMSILTVLVIGIAIVGLVSPVIAGMRPCLGVGVMGTITEDGAPAVGWDVKVEFYDYGDSITNPVDDIGWCTLLDRTEVDSSGNYASGCKFVPPGSGTSGENCPPLGAYENRNYRRWIWDQNGDIVIGGEERLPECGEWVEGDCTCALVWDYTAQPYIPEFSTIAIPVVSILGLLLFFNYRKRRGNK